MPLYGHEMDDTVSPFETGLGWAVKMHKDDFIGKAALVGNEQPARRRVGIEITGRGIAREHCDVYLNGKKIGVTTSGTHCPYLGKAVAMALYFFNFSSWTGKRGLFLEDLFVSPEVRGLGLGLDLLKRLAAIAVANDCGRMEWNVLDWNNSAKGFYEMLGARHAVGWEVWRLEGEALKTLGG